MGQDEEAAKNLEKGRSERFDPREEKASRKSEWPSQIRAGKVPTELDTGHHQERAEDRSQTAFVFRNKWAIQSF